jgi:hypothetical protein
MPTWTQAEQDALRAAIASGVVSVTYADRSVTYNSLSEMRLLLAEMDRQILAAPSYRIATFSKGA